MVVQNLPSVPGVSHRRVRAGALTVHVAEAGDGDPLVLLHGWPQHWYCWRHLIGPLAESRRVICPDLRGLGWSDAPDRGYDKRTLAQDLLALLDALQLDRVDLVGHDWGGYTSYLAALEAPERIARVALLGIITPDTIRVRGRSLLNLPLLSYQAALALPGLGPRTLTSSSALLKLVFTNWTAGTPDREATASYAERLREPARARASAQMYRTFLTRELPAALRGSHRPRELEMPVLRLMGERDFLRRLADDAPGTVLVPGAGHFIPEESPQAVLSALRGFLGP